MGTILNGVVGVTSRPFPVDLMVLTDLLKLVPEVLVQDSLAIGLHPTVGLPPGNKCGYPLLQVLGIANQADAT